MFKLHLPLVVLFATLACTTGDGDGDGDTNGNGNGNEGGGEVPASYNSNSAWPSTGFPDRVPDETLSGDISNGSVIDISWAATGESNYCWVATENENFDGAHTFHELDQPAGTDIFLLLEPTSDQVDLSMYTMQFDGTLSTPPNLSSPPWSCDTVFDQEADDNPGQAEAIYLPNYTDFEVLVGVTGTDGDSQGEYTLKVWYVAGNEHDTAR